MKAENSWTIKNMDLISKLETEWSKNFPEDPLPSNILREKSYNHLSLQNIIRKCEQTIDDLNKKLRQEIFLRDFLKNFTEKSLHTTGSKNETDNSLQTDFLTSKQTSKPIIGSFITETESISAMVLKEDEKNISTELTNLQTQNEQDVSVDCQISKTLTVNMGENISTDVNNQELFSKQKFRNSMGSSFNALPSNNLKPRSNRQNCKSMSLNNVYTHQKQRASTLQPTASVKKGIPPSLPPKPKKKHLSSATSNSLLSNNNKSDNNNGIYKHCSDYIKTIVSQNENLDAAADPHVNIGRQLLSDCFCSIEVGNCSGYCANDVKAGLVKSGTKPVKNSVKQVAASSQSVLKQQRGLTTTTTTTAATKTDSPTTVLVTEERLTNISVEATGNSQVDNTDKQNINFDDTQDYSCCDNTFQSRRVEDDKDLPHSLLTSLVFAEQRGGRRGKPGERSHSFDIAGQEYITPQKSAAVPTKKSTQSNSLQPQNKSDAPNNCDQQEQTITVVKQTNERNQKETESNRNREGKGSIGNSQLSSINKEELFDGDKEEGSVNNKSIKEDAIRRSKDIKIKEAESTGNSHDNTDDTDMSTYKKQREDICFVSYRKLDTEFQESSFTNSSTLPLPQRRSSLLKDNDTISEESLKDTVSVFAEKTVAPSPSSLERNSTVVETFSRGNSKDSAQKTSQENYGVEFGIMSENVNSSGFSIDYSPVDTYSILKQEHPSLPLDVEKNVDYTQNAGISQDADKEVVEDCCIEVKRNDSGEYRTCIELTDDDESDSSDKRTLKSVNSEKQQSFSNSEEDTDEEILSSIYENEQFDSLEDINLLKMRKQAVRQFLATEEVFVENLENIQKLMDQFSATIDSKDSLLSKTDFEVIFFKISEILSLHQTCVKQLEPKVKNWQNNETVGFILKELMIHFPTFEEYTKNYPFAVETINKCSQINGHFKRIAEEASLNPEMQKSSLNVLLYKPISQLQFNTSFIQELLQYTPKNHADYEIIENTWRLTQHNLTSITNKNDEDKTENEQYLLKSDYLVELVGNVRKLRCFFLFNDVLVCTKQKFWQKGSFDVKWFIPISELLLDTNSDNDEMKYHSKETIDEIKRKISCLETELRKENDKDKLSDRAREKLKKKFSELQRELARLSGYLEFNLKHNKKTYTLLMSTDYAWEEWKETLCGLKDKCVFYVNFTASEVQQLISNCKKLPSISNLSSHQQADKIEERGFVGLLIVTLHELTGLDESCTTYCCLELDSCGQFFTKARSVDCNEAHPVWNEEFELELDYSHTLRILCYKKGRDNQGDILLGKSALALSKDWLPNFTRKTISMNKISLVISINHLPPNKTLQRIPSKVKTGTFGVNIQKVAHHQNRPFPAIISICTQEIEKRGLHEVGIYRVSGGQSDVKKLKHAFEKNTMRARKMIADPDFNIHAVAAVLKLFFRELPEPLFTIALHNKFLAVNDIYDAEMKKKKVIMLIHSLPDVNYHTLIHLLDHLQRISEHSAINKMTNSNLAVIFGQSLMQPAPSSDQSSVEMASFLNAHLQNDVLEYIINLQCNAIHLGRL